ncbi:MAG TPA: type II toxin-antitoxin system PemK/MazF family toxin [Actinomycetes bacterium]|nr:type II toxin-antitoxin system PemK/MazF family toxin [Actinomycetes bacterium]
MSEIWPLVRGRVYAARMSHLEEDKYFLVVSNNRRNRQLPQVLAVRLTTTPKPPLPSIVPLVRPEVFVGSVVCDDIVEIYPDEVRRDLGALSPAAMAAVGRGLAAALGLERP